jgi:hypothetical protein
MTSKERARRRVLGFRYYSHRPKARRALFVRMYGRLALFKQSWRAARRAGRARYLSFLAALTAAKTAARYVPRKKWDAPVQTVLRRKGMR